MQTILFGRTGRMTTRLGFGAWAIGGTWGEVSLADARAALHAALDAGMTFIDTADVYATGGPNGSSARCWPNGPASGRSWRPRPGGA